jgi:hypothetical protein
MSEQLSLIDAARESLKKPFKTFGEVRQGRFEHDNKTYVALEQNRKKGTRFAKLALRGHEVFWIIDADNQWQLVVDGSTRKKEEVSKEGELM